MRRLSIFLTMALALVSGACSSTPDTPTTTAPPTINTFSGTWRSTTTANAAAGACSSTNWTITPTGANTANIAYTATCSGIPISGTGSGTLNGTTLAWNTTGTAANSCAFGLSGTAVPENGTDLRVSYGGTVCGVPVSGVDVLRH